MNGKLIFGNDSWRWEHSTALAEISTDFTLTHKECEGHEHILANQIKSNSVTTS
jgi:hypothetical protein